MIVWLQRHDLTSENLEDPSIESALATLESFDWAEEIQKENEAGKSGRESCAAGMGMTHEDGHILHVIPTVGDTFVCHYQFPVRQRKRLGIFGKTSHPENLSFKDVEKKDLLSTIRAHYLGNHGQVMNRLAQMATRI